MSGRGRVAARIGYEPSFRMPLASDWVLGKRAIWLSEVQRVPTCCLSAHISYRHPTAPSKGCHE